MPYSNGAIDAFEAPATREGRFRLTDIPAGNYMLMVSDVAEGRSWNSVVHDLPVLDDVTDLLLVAGPSVWVSGRVTSEDGGPVPFDATELQVVAEQRTGSLGIHGAGFGKVAADGGFTMLRDGRSPHLALSRGGSHIAPARGVDGSRRARPPLAIRLPISLDELGQATLHVRVVPAPTDVLESVGNHE